MRDLDGRDASAIIAAVAPPPGSPRRIANCEVSLVKCAIGSHNVFSLATAASGPSNRPVWLCEVMSVHAG